MLAGPPGMFRALVEQLPRYNRLRESPPTQMPVERHARRGTTSEGTACAEEQ